MANRRVIVRYFEFNAHVWSFITDETAKIKTGASCADLNDNICKSYPVCRYVIQLSVRLC